MKNRRQMQYQLNLGVYSVKTLRVTGLTFRRDCITVVLANSAMKTQLVSFSTVQMMCLPLKFLITSFFEVPDLELGLLLTPLLFSTRAEKPALLLCRDSSAIIYTQLSLFSFLWLKRRVTVVFFSLRTVRLLRSLNALRCVYGRKRSKPFTDKVEAERNSSSSQPAS